MADETNQGAARNWAEPLIRMDKYLDGLSKTGDAVFAKLIRNQSKVRARTAAGWAEFLAELKNAPAQ